MKRRHTLAWFACSVMTFAFIGTGLAQHQHTAGSMNDEDLIKSAMAAAPPTIAKDASVAAVATDGQMRVLRKGTNGFTCLPDNPNTPGPDPMCGDQNAMEWAKAWIEKKEPPKNKVGFLYMLSGGTDASNTDPYAQKPEANNNWIETGPHVMVVGAKGMMEGYPRSPKPDTAQPYVMWPDTPYEHLMLPVSTPEAATR
ncbi:hypothetical protein MHY87_12030 [Microvirga sp. ACRRW]|uniref:hypothetical protein n=1 Tax=Microvirga sp. ACRRW TaxID=2918205 RepID=UPI001EF49FBF|nr:hypothetical protein [Microvirga sp. ACRRW]MCG7393636.1 hypothetical protein [Microvirga sp. ACRRW]